MSKYLQKHIKLHMISKKWLAIFALILIGSGVICGITFAKYYANSSNKGVAAAANYYFSSNVLDKPLTEGEDEWKTVYNTEAWDGTGEYPFEVKIRNYQNQLLYNSKNLDLEYSISFELLEADGGSYAVAYGTEQKKTLTVGEVVTYDDLVIAGGKANSDELIVYFNAPADADEEYRSPKIKVVAQITGPDFLAKTDTQIGGYLQAGVVKADYLLKGEYTFSVSSVDTTWSDAGREIVDSMAAFPYTITYHPGVDNAAHDILVSWDASKLQLNYFDENYSNVETDTETGISSIQITMRPNETKQLIFYRTDEFVLDEIPPSDFLRMIELVDLDLDGAE